MAGWSPASVVIASFLILHLGGKIKVNEACSVFCPPEENICTCPNGKPKPTPDPNALIQVVIQDSCGGLIHYCSVGGVCKPEENGCPANCPQICTLDYSPVCGTDTKTYSNQCHLEVTACKTRNDNLTVASVGECPECQTFCTFEYAPVCGSDGNTYSNECSLKSKSCRDRSNLAVAYSGECSKKCDSFCGDSHIPVCGSDGQTYMNECWLTFEACRQRSGLTVDYDGECGSGDSLGQITVLGPGALPPAWAQVENTDDCLKQYKPTSPRDATHFEVCAPLSKPAECSQLTWWALATSLNALPQDEVVFAKPPPYLQIEGVRDCLDSYKFGESTHTEACLPLERPKHVCSPDSWDSLVAIWDGIKCPKDNLHLSGERVRPEYLSVPGWQRCLLDYKSGSYTKSCKPSYKPLLCSPGAWSALATKFKGATCPSVPRVIASPKILPPAYLLIEGHDKCLNSHTNGAYNVKCLPESKPAPCSTAIWDKVKDTFDGIPCPKPSEMVLGIGGTPPAYLRVEGFNDCLGTFNTSSHTEFCLPSSRPVDCKVESWKELKNDGVFKGIKCPLTGLPPAYLSIDGYKKCLSTYQASSSSQALCMPAEKPRRCRQNAWEQLKTQYYGVKCPSSSPSLIGGIGAPAYLSIVGHQKCLGENNDGGYTSICMPSVKPENCEDDTFKQLIQIGPPDAPLACKPKPLLTGIPPAYLGIVGHADCLGEITSSDGGHVEVCLPKLKPINCTVGAWSGMQDTFKGQDCAPLLGGLGALKPPYLSVSGHKDCLLVQENEPSGHKELCLPNSKPDLCIPNSWKELTEGKFNGRKCRPVQVIGIPAPMFTQVPGYKKCLDSQQSSSGTHNEFCLPSSKPSACDTNSWDKLQQVFIGSDCTVQLLGGPSSLPPKYLSIVGHHQCLSTDSPSGSHREICLPDVKPVSCVSSAWDKLQEEVTAGRMHECQPQVIVGGPNVLPPKYLSIVGHQDCLSAHSPSPGASHREICLPSGKSTNCTSIAWDKLKVEVDTGRINKCRQVIPTLGGQSGLPPSYLSIPGHGRCLTSQPSTVGSSHNEVCLPKSKPQACTPEAWQKLETELRQGNINQCRLPRISMGTRPVLGGGLQALPPTYLSVDGWSDCTRGFEASDSHNELCLPLGMPSEPCTSKAYKELMQIAFAVEQTRSTSMPGILDAQPPEYLFVKGHDNCLDDHSVGSHREKCLPSVRPNGCDSSAWVALQNVFVGNPCRTCQKFCTLDDEPVCGSDNVTYTNKCVLEYTACKEQKTLTIQNTGNCITGRPRPQLGGGLLSLPPTYLSIVGHEECLSSQKPTPRSSHTEVCLPQSRPDSCIPPAYDLLKEEVLQGKIKKCRSVPLLGGGLLSLPPTYLSIVGHEECLSSQKPTPRSSHTEVCLPQSRPDSCIPPAYNLLKGEVLQGKIKKCRSVPLLGGGLISLPPTYLSIVGHEECISSQPISSHIEVCLPQSRPSSCILRAYELLQQEVLEGRMVKCTSEPLKQEGETCGHYGRGFVVDYDGECESDLTCEPSGNPDTPGTCIRKPAQIKQEGESCGHCFSPGTNFFCGLCASGLECTKDPRADLLPDLPSKCKKKPAQIKQEGESCGHCFSPGTNFFCGLCASGLECTKDPRADILPDLPSKCKKKPVTGCPNGEPRVNCLVDPCQAASCPSNPEAICRANYCGGCNAVFYDVNGVGVVACGTTESYSCYDECIAIGGKGGRECAALCKDDKPIRQEGENCDDDTFVSGPNFVHRGECAPGLVCKYNIPFSDAPGVCEKEQVTGCPNGEPRVNCFADPCQAASCPSNPEATCRANYCGGCNAVFYDINGVGVVACGAKPCDGRSCGQTCVVGGDMAGQCNVTGECSFDYDNLGCGGGPILFPVIDHNPFAEVTECEITNPCTIEYNGKIAFCHKVITLGVPGVCVPRAQSCTTRNDCVSVGNIHSGQYGASCNNMGICEYDPIERIA